MLKRFETQKGLKMTIDKVLENELYDNGIYEAWQFVKNTERTLHIAKYCKDTISRLIAVMQQEHEDWKEALFEEVMAREDGVREISITSETLPVYNTAIVGEEISSRFLLDKLTKDFFQYVRNVFDSMSQIANVALLGAKAKKADSVDFPAMLKVFNQQTYSQDFPDISSWYNAVSADPAFQYIDAFNNRTKHTCDVYLKVTMDFLGDNHSSNINPFYRKEVQHDKKDIVIYMNEIFDFVSKSFDDFMSELKKEYPKKTYLYNRYNKFKGWQQKMNSNPESDFAVIYFESADDISALPDDISVLLLNRCDDGKIYCKNCNIDAILVKKTGTEHEFIGRYVADEPCGDDTLLRYRKYHKDAQVGQVTFVKTTFEWRTHKTFYKWNPYISFTTVSDDDFFLARSQMPI